MRLNGREWDNRVKKVNRGWTNNSKALLKILKETYHYRSFIKYTYTKERVCIWWGENVSTINHRLPNKTTNAWNGLQIAESLIKEISWTSVIDHRVLQRTLIVFVNMMIRPYCLKQHIHMLCSMKNLSLYPVRRFSLLTSSHGVIR